MFSSKTLLSPAFLKNSVFINIKQKMSGVVCVTSLLFAPLSTTILDNLYIFNTATETFTEIQNLHAVQPTVLPEVQTLTVFSPAITEVSRDSFDVIAPPPPPPPPVVNKKNVQPSWDGQKDYGTFTNNPDAAVQYPFGVGMKITSPYGHRDAVCTNSFGCGSNAHAGIDYGASEGTPIQNIADGKVLSVNHGGAYGLHVIIEHKIDGVLINSLYAHMQAGSSPLKTGDEVKVGDLVGKVGSTGRSTGSHLHFELRLNGMLVDPATWDKWNTGQKL